MCKMCGIVFLPPAWRSSATRWYYLVWISLFLKWKLLIIDLSLLKNFVLLNLKIKFLFLRFLSLVWVVNLIVDFGSLLVALRAPHATSWTGGGDPWFNSGLVYCGSLASDKASQAVMHDMHFTTLVDSKIHDILFWRNESFIWLFLSSFLRILTMGS